MSTGASGKYIYCDGKDCQSKALAPVALHSFSPNDPETAFSTVGWLFVHENGRTCHFCPHCAPYYLSSLTHNDHAMEFSDVSSAPE